MLQRRDGRSCKSVTSNNVGFGARKCVMVVNPRHIEIWFSLPPAYARPLTSSFEFGRVIEVGVSRGFAREAPQLCIRISQCGEGWHVRPVRCIWLSCGGQSNRH